MSSRSNIVFITSETAPTDAAIGDEWHVPSTGVLYKFMAATTGVSWVNINSGIPIGNIASRPLRAPSGTMRINSDTSNMEIYYNSTWNTLQNITNIVATGGTISYNGIYKIHTFTSTDNFIITAISPSITIEYLVVAGGGGGGSDMGGGGGGGGLLTGSLNQSTGTYVVTVGAGGAGAPAGTSGPPGFNGIDSSIIKSGVASLTALGGGGGASKHDSSSYPAGSGGSGGGGSGGRQSGGSYGGSPGTGTAGQGNNGAGSGVHWYPGGGGGAGAAASQTGSEISHGGIGKFTDFISPGYYWAGGGGGAGYSNIAGNGGLGGGGGGAPKVGGGGLGGLGYNKGLDGTVGTLVAQTNVPGGNAGANTGGGGGGGAHYNSNNWGGNGGSGMVIIRYIGR